MLNECKIYIINIKYIIIKNIIHETITENNLVDKNFHRNKDKEYPKYDFICLLDRNIQQYKAKKTERI